MNTQATTKASTSSVPVKVSSGSQHLLQEVEDFTKKIAQRAFDLFEKRGRQDGHDVCDWSRAEAEIFGPSGLEIGEADDGFTVRAQVPGFDAKDLNVTVDSRTIFLRGKSERKSGTESEDREYYQRMDLPQTVNPEKATAILKDGALELRLPKSAARVEVKPAA